MSTKINYGWYKICKKIVLVTLVYTLEIENSKDMKIKIYGKETCAVTTLLLVEK
jgi:hypothetical protein